MTTPDPVGQSIAPSSPVAAALRNRSWEAYSVIVATVVGLLSLAVSAYTAYTLHVQTRAQVFPYVQLIELGEQHRVGFFNKGVGPAFVRRMTVTVDGKPTTSWRQFFAAVGMPLKGTFTYSSVNHVPIAANETSPALNFNDVADFEAFQAIDSKRYRIDLCYCSVLDECWLLSTTADALPEPQRIRSCPVDPATDFTQ